MTTAATSRPTMPPCAHVPKPYTGPTRSEVLATRRQYANPAIFTIYKDPLMLVEGHRQWLFDETGKRYLDLLAGIVTVSCGHAHPKITKRVQEQVAALAHTTTIYLHPLMGEFEIRHYPSPRHIERGELFRDVEIPIDGPHGHRLFAFAERTGIPFQIHYEIEDALLGPLEAMLARYPGAKVIWCHLAQVRYASRAGRYGAAYMRDMFGRHPNLYVDTAFGGRNSIYQLSGERHARIWDESGDIRRDWRDLIQESPYRFLAALDIGGDRMDRVQDSTRSLRGFLTRIPGRARDIVAYGASWKLLFGEEIVA